MELNFEYSYNITKYDDNEYILKFNIIPEALTSGKTENEAISLAEDALIGAIKGYIKNKREIPQESEIGGHKICLSPLISAKLILYILMRHYKITNVKLASLLKTDEKVIRRMIDLDAKCKITTIEKAVKLIGKNVEPKQNYRLKISLKS